jgi:hypothetical protein
MQQTMIETGTQPQRLLRIAEFAKLAAVGTRTAIG